MAGKEVYSAEQDETPDALAIFEANLRSTGITREIYDERGKKIPIDDVYPITTKAFTFDCNGDKSGLRLSMTPQEPGVAETPFSFVMQVENNSPDAVDFITFQAQEQYFLRAWTPSGEEIKLGSYLPYEDQFITIQAYIDNYMVLPGGGKHVDVVDFSSRFKPPMAGPVILQAYRKFGDYVLVSNPCLVGGLGSANGESAARE